MAKLILCGKAVKEEEENDNLSINQSAFNILSCTNSKQVVPSDVKLKSAVASSHNSKYIDRTSRGNDEKIPNKEDLNNNNFNENNFYDDINQFNTNKINGNGSLIRPNEDNVDSNRIAPRQRYIKKEELNGKGFKNYNFENSHNKSYFSYKSENNDSSCWTLFLDDYDDDDDDDEEEDALGNDGNDVWFKNAFPCTSRKKQENNKLEKNKKKSMKNKLHNFEENNVVYDNYSIPNDAVDAVFPKVNNPIFKPNKKNNIFQKNKHSNNKNYDDCAYNTDNKEDNSADNDYNGDCLHRRKNKKIIQKKRNYYTNRYNKTKANNSSINNNTNNNDNNYTNDLSDIDKNFNNYGKLCFGPDSKVEMSTVPEERICYVDNLTGKFTTVRKIGSGTFGNVFLAVRKKDQKKVSLKILAKDRTKIEDFCLEFRYSRMFCKHPSVIGTFLIAYVTTTWYVLVQEYAPMSDLLRAVPPRIGLPEVTVKLLLRQMTEAILFVHSKDIVHRDLKLENFLVFQDNSVSDQAITKVKLSDFGVARRIGTMVCKVCEGTTYTPPEICNLPRHSHYTVETSADIWSLGVIVFSLLTGSFPWQMANLINDSLFVNFARWQNKHSDKPPEHWTRFSGTLARLFHRLLNLNPHKRGHLSTLHRYLDRPWIIAAQPSASTNSQSPTCRSNSPQRENLSFGVSASASVHAPSSFSSFSDASSRRSYCLKTNRYSANNCSSCNKNNSNQTTGNKTYTTCNHSTNLAKNAKETRKSSMTTDDAYGKAPFMTSGSLYSPLLDHDQTKRSTILCGRHNETNCKDENHNSRAVSLHRYQHFHPEPTQQQPQCGTAIHHSRRESNELKTNKHSPNTLQRINQSQSNNQALSATPNQPSDLSKRIPPSNQPTYHTNNHCQFFQECNKYNRNANKAGNEKNEAEKDDAVAKENETEKEAKLRLDRVNRWLTNHVSFN